MRGLGPIIGSTGTRFMSVEAFVDTNIFMYAAMGRVDDPPKYARAWEIVDEGKFGVSAQVLAEFYVNATRKTATPLTSAEASAWVERLCSVPVAAIDAETVLEAIAHQQRFQINYWDAALIAAAENLGAPILYTEDMNHRQKYGSVTVINPFRAN